jgi:protein-tyrosine phosphatase
MLDQDVRDRRLRCEPCLNIRDVGGYRTSDGATIRWRTLLRGDNLCNLSADGATVLLDYGVRTVIDLRYIAELEEAVHPFGPLGSHTGVVGYQHLPLRHPDDVDLDAAYQACQSLAEIYQIYLDHGGVRFAAIARAIATAPDGAVMVHCHVGKDRTGIVVALLLALANVPAETIIADYALSAEYLRPLFDESKRANPEIDDALWHSRPETMQSWLERLETIHGGAERYFLTAGLTPEEIERLRARLREEPASIATPGAPAAP